MGVTMNGKNYFDVRFVPRGRSFAVAEKLEFFFCWQSVSIGNDKLDIAKLKSI
jgi:hypothetical protein